MRPSLAKRSLGRRQGGRLDGGGAAVRRHLAEMRRLEAELPFRPPRRLWREWSWILLTGVAFSAYGLAVAFGAGSLPGRMLDALRLFPSGWPGSGEGDPWQLVLARHLAAIVSAVVTLRVVYALLADRVLELRARLRSGHVVVCGLGEKGLRSARAFRATGARVTCVDLVTAGDAADDARSRGAIVLDGDATQLVTLRGAAVEEADHVVCACRDDAANARIAFLATRRTHQRAPGLANVYAHIADPELARLLRGPALGLRAARLHFFNIHDVWARTLLDDPASPFAEAQACGVLEIARVERESGG